MFQVWIHGGAYIAGSAFSYNGAMLSATREVIVVTINYRLGVLGFLNIPGTNVSGNYGLMDQILALKWVSNHIGDFGGDRSQVGYLFLKSAGNDCFKTGTPVPLKGTLGYLFELRSCSFY